MRGTGHERLACDCFRASSAPPKNKMMSLKAPCFRSGCATRRATPAQELSGVKPDMMTLAKPLAGLMLSFPVARKQ